MGAFPFFLSFFLSLSLSLTHSHFQGDCHKRKRENGALIKVKQNEDKNPQLESISSSAPGQSCNNNQESKNHFGSLNVEMIVKMCTWKIAG